MSRRQMSPRTEKTLRLVSVCVLASAFGIVSVATDSQVWGYIAAGIILAGILVGPISARMLVRPSR